MRYASVNSMTDAIWPKTWRDLVDLLERRDGFYIQLRWECEIRGPFGTRDDALDEAFTRIAAAKRLVLVEG